MDKKSLFVLILLVGLGIGAIVWRQILQAELKNNGILVQAKIVGVDIGGKSSGGFHCLIVYKGKQIHALSPTTYERNRYKLVGKTFPAMYAPQKQILELLITRKDFAKFNIAFPDSLLWVEKGSRDTIMVPPPSQ